MASMHLGESISPQQVGEGCLLCADHGDLFVLRSHGHLFLEWQRMKDIGGKKPGFWAASLFGASMGIAIPMLPGGLIPYVLGHVYYAYAIWFVSLLLVVVNVVIYWRWMSRDAIHWATEGGWPDLSPADSE